jgi:hypothetical protein
LLEAGLLRLLTAQGIAQPVGRSIHLAFGHDTDLV